MSGWKEWAIGEVVEAGDLQSYIQDQTVQVYANSTARDTALGASVAEGMVSYLQDTNAVEAYDGSAWASVGQDLTGGTAGYTAVSNGASGLSYQPVSHNYIINGAFDVWQRGTSFTGALNFDFTADRWATNVSTSDVGLNWSVTQQPFTSADLEVTGFGEGQFYLRSTLIAKGSANDPRLRYRIEDVRTLANQGATLSFWVRSSTDTAMSFLGVQNFGSGGSGVVTFGAQGVTIDSSWSRVILPITPPSISGKTIGAGSYTELRFRYADAGVSDGANLDIWGVQLEAGSIATPFKRNAPSLQGELAACQRYYYRLDADSSAGPLAMGFANGTSTARALFEFPVKMRIKPSALEQTGTASDYQIHYTGTSATTCIAVPTFIGANESKTYAQFTASGLTGGQSVMIRTNSTSSYLAWSAEL